MSKAKYRRLVIATDGEGLWYVRRVAYVVRDAIKNEMIYHCDKPIGRKFVNLNDAVRKTKDIISNPRSRAWR